jgi:hypothetical protein
MTKICSALWALAGGLCLAFSSAAFAAAPPMIPVTVTPASGNPGSMVQPVFSFDVTGFEFESFDLVLSYSAPLLSLDLGNSSVTVNGVTGSWANILPFATTTSGSGTYEVHAFAVSPTVLTGPIVLRPAFTIGNAAPLGPTQVQIAGSIGSEPAIGERYFDNTGTVTVTAVPEPEIWLMWLGGIGLLAWRRARLQR